jgi:hypothetical protein
MTVEATIAGEGCSLVLRVSGYERPEQQTGSDANWLNAEVELNASTTGTFRASHSVSLRTEEIAEFRDQLSSVLEALTGTAVLEHLEAEVGCTIRLKNGVGELEAFVREAIGAELRVKAARTDQSYLQETLRQMDSIVSAFPVKGDPFR